MSELTVTNLESQLISLSSLSTDSLKRELAIALDLTAQTLLKMAAIVKLLEERGEDLSELRLSMLSTLRLIAHGQVASEAVVRFARNPMLLGKIAKLPLPDQKRLASGDQVEVAEVDSAGQLTFRKFDPLLLRARQIKSIFAEDHIRTPAEQVVVIQAARLAPQKQRVSRTTVQPDPERRALRIGAKYVPVSEVLNALAQLSQSDDGERSETVAVKLTDAEKRRLQACAGDAGKTLNDIVRMALKAVGMI